MDKVILIGGSTGSGKSAYAYELAQKQNGVIINGDSLQVYKGLEILTAQPSLHEQQTLPHRLYGIFDPSTSCFVGKWLELALGEIREAHQRGKVPIVVGGTGFYLKALLEGLSPIPPCSSSIRETLQKRHEGLYEELQEVDRSLAARLHPQDRQRVMRGLEVFYGTGIPLSTWQVQKPSVLPYAFEKILFTLSPEVLQPNLERRLTHMLAHGLLEEVGRLLTSPLSKNAEKAIGFREFKDFLQGQCSLEDAKKLTLVRTRQYAKRQRTWFRHQFSQGAEANPP